MATNHPSTATPPPANQNPPGRWPLWSTRPQEKPLAWYIKVPGTIREAIAAGDLQAHHVPALTALHALLPVPGQATYNPDAQNEVVGRPAVLAAATGVSAATLRDWLTGTGPLTPYATRQRTFWLPEDECDTDASDTGERWVIQVTPHAEGAWLAVPAWWLLARTHATLRNNRRVERRLLRGLLRTPQGWIPGPPGDPRALLGALMVIERSDFGTTPPRIYSYAVPTLAKRWGLSEATAYRYLNAAETAGYLASQRRTGGHGKAAVRTAVITPEQAPGVPLPPGCGQRRRGFNLPDPDA